MHRVQHVGFEKNGRKCGWPFDGRKREIKRGTCLTSFVRLSLRFIVDSYKMFNLSRWSAPRNQTSTFDQHRLTACLISRFRWSWIHAAVGQLVVNNNAAGCCRNCYVTAKILLKYETRGPPRRKWWQLVSYYSRMTFNYTRNTKHWVRLRLNIMLLLMPRCEYVKCLRAIMFIFWWRNLHAFESCKICRLRLNFVLAEG